MPEISKYLAFYLSKPFWVKDAIDLQAGFPEGFSNLMEEQMFIYEDETLDLRLCRDGRFLLRLKLLSGKDSLMSFLGSMKTISAYVKNVNALALIFESVFIKETKNYYFETKELTNQECFGVRYENGKWAGESVQQLEKFQHARMGLNIGPFPNPAMQPIFLMRPIVSLEIVQETANIYKTIFANEWLISLVSSLNKSISEYKIANYDTALVLSWFIIESIISDKWAQWIASKEEKIPGRINRERKKRLQGRDYPISVRLNIMEMNEVISLELYQMLDKVRANRNSIVHREKDYWCSPEDAQSAIQAANTLIQTHFDLELHLNLSFRWSSI